MGKSTGGEFGFISDIERLFSSINSDGVVKSIGDDCAVIERGDRYVVVTTDMLVEGVHFILDATSPYLLGRKSLAVNLSDIAAMGAKPTFTLLSIALPECVQGGWAEEFMRGYHSLAGEYNVGLIGGDTTASKSGVVVNVVAVGEVDRERVKLRSMAVEGDLIVVLGTLGESAAGLRDILQGRCDTYLAEIHKNPKPHIEQGCWLSSFKGVHAMMDISDGLASDLRHILSQSNVGAEVEVFAVPFETTIEDAVCGGEDYKLLLTVDPGKFDQLNCQFEAQFGYRMSVIGRITDGSSGLVWYENGVEISPKWEGFSHF